jgi:hypothetical protein
MGLTERQQVQQIQIILKYLLQEQQQLWLTKKSNNE